MADRPAESTRVENLQAKTEGDDLWHRLRASTERLGAIGLQRLGSEALAQKLAARAEQLRGRMTTESVRETPLVILAFSKGSDRFGVPVDAVVEVHTLRRFSPVPGTPSFIAGVIHWRGDILALVDLSKLFGFPESGLADLHVCLIIEAAGQRLAIAALEIEEIIAVPASELRAAPELPGIVSTEWLLGVHDNNRVILNMELILQDTRLVEWRKE